jgi:hypothetical protein
MKSHRISLLLLSLSLSSAMFANAAHAGAPSGTSADFGSAAPAAAPAKVINLAASTKYVNVTDGDTVRFVQGDSSFTWHFEIFPNRDVFKLSNIAPATMHVDGVEVYVAANPLYAN